jgi:uncharacterized repeat protein (TIGR01451 family)
MKLTRFLGILAAVLGSSLSAASQAPSTPLIYVRLVGPQGSTATFLPGPEGTFPLPSTVALRVGHVYVVRLETANSASVEPVYASIHVGDGLRLGPRQNAAQFPAPLIFSSADWERAAAGTLVTKVIVLEDPRRVRTQPPAPSQPAEVELLPDDDLWLEAGDLGRPLLVARLGAREPDVSALQRYLLSWATWSPHALGPRDPWGLPIIPPPKGGEECLRDGGDQGTPTHHDSHGRLQGIDPADTVAEYRQFGGKRNISVTNETCLCVPRFVLVRQLTPLVAVERILTPQQHEQTDQGIALNALQKARRQRQVDESRDVRGRARLWANVTVKGSGTLKELTPLRAVEIHDAIGAAIGRDEPIHRTEVTKARLKRQLQLAIRLSDEEGVHYLARRDGTAVIGKHENLGQVVSTWEMREAIFICPQQEPEIPAEPLLVQKWCNAESAQIGDVVTFYIRYSNLGGKPISDIAVVDSLVSRLEYVAGSARSDRDAVFVTQPNEAGSLILRWEIKDPLPPGQKGVVSFQVRVK